MNTFSDNFRVHIRSRRSIWEVDWQGLFHYRDLLWLLVRRDFVSKYKQTILGPAWMLIQPLATTIVFTVIFGKVAKMSTEGAPPMLFYLGGLLAWNLFAQILGSTGNVLRANMQLFGKVYFPRLIVPLANALSAMIPFAIQLGLFLIVYLYHSLFTPYGDHLRLDSRILLLPVFVFQSLLTGFGTGLLIGALTAVYRDLEHLLGFLLQIWMYATPIIFPISHFPENWRWAVQLNPMSVPVEGIKWIFLNGGSLSTISVTYSWVVTLALVVGGFYTFNTVQRSYVDRA